MIDQALDLLGCEVFAECSFGAANQQRVILCDRDGQFLRAMRTSSGIGHAEPIEKDVARRLRRGWSVLSPQPHIAEGNDLVDE